MATTDAKPIPLKGVAYRVTFPIFDNDGDLVAAATGLDSEISKDHVTFVDCTNEATEIASSSGMYYLDLTATEMNADTVAIVVKTSSTDAKTTPIVLYPEEAGDVRVNVTQISGDTTAADNLESYADGTTPIPANMTQISGDSTVADNLEAALDGTGGVTFSVVLGTDAITTASIASGAFTAAKFDEDFFEAIVTAILASDAFEPLFTGTLSAGGASTATLPSPASTTEDFCKGAYVVPTAGTGVGQSGRHITAYSTGREMTFNFPFATALDTDTVVAVYDSGQLAEISSVMATTLLDLAISGHTTSGTVGGTINSAASAGDPWSTALPGAYAEGTAGHTVGTNLDGTVSSRQATLDATARQAIADALLQRQMTEGYATDGTAPTLEQILFMLLSWHQRAVSGTAVTTKKLDGTTTAMSYTMDSASAPTSITRSG